ncbi:MAG: (d)CMP kinase [Acidimicrobiales bacterium]
MLVTISGLPGSGTSTVAQRVAGDLGLTHLDGGTIFRRLAADAGMSLADFGAFAERHPEVDLALDSRLAERVRQGDVVLESRLGGWIAHNEGLDAVRVWLACAAEVRATRVARRDGLTQEEALEVNRAREASEQTRYLAYYGIDLGDLGLYHLVLDSAATAPEELAATVADHARSG